MPSAVPNEWRWNTKKNSRKQAYKSKLWKLKVSKKNPGSKNFFRKSLPKTPKCDFPFFLLNFSQEYDQLKLDYDKLKLDFESLERENQNSETELQENLEQYK